MKLFEKNQIQQVFPPRAALSAALLGLGVLVSAPAAQAGDEDLSDVLGEVIVTARRTDETLQTVPISMTVFSQESLAERNVVSATDLANYTPSLSVNTRLGTDNASFAIRGFTQELRTTASVAVYFADVVAPRGGGAVTAGDGAGPGAFFDLQNVQVLKGPQGTLFGRNTTGGAIQLVPQEPTSQLEGYVELSGGNYGMRREQGVINVPITDTIQTRFGIDKMERDGYIKNVSGIGPDHYSDIDYISGRASMIMQITDSLQNYTILTYSESNNNGSLMGLFACRPPGESTVPSLGGQFLDCQDQLARQDGDFYTIASSEPDPTSELTQWQAINTTTWDANDDLTVKNIIAYGYLDQINQTSNFGADLSFNGTKLYFYPRTRWGNLSSTAQSTFVEELQFSGSAFDEALSWVAGLYFENSRPDGVSGYQSPLVIYCSDVSGDNPANWNCANVFAGQGSVTNTLSEVEYINKAVYSQATYELTDEFRLTGGFRYTVDETRATGYQAVWKEFPTSVENAGAPTEVTCALEDDRTPWPDTDTPAPECAKKENQKSEAPTGVIGIDYLPSSDVMTYAKYSRGYRQGAVNPAGPAGAQTFDPEKVDAYEIGSKLSFDGWLTGTFNVGLFYNDLKDQQLQVGYQDTTGQHTPTTAIYNAGRSEIKGAEIESTLLLMDGLIANISYTYLETKLKEFEYPTQAVYNTELPAAIEGGELTFAPRHNLTLGLSYAVPVPADLGDMSIGGSYTYVDKQYGTGNSPTYGEIDSHKLLNLNMSWYAIFQSAFDASLFVTNLTDEEWVAYTPGMYDTFAGMEFRTVGEPRMWGARIRYNFAAD